MKQFLGILFMCMLVSCEPTTQKNISPTQQTSANYFHVTGTFNNYFTEYVYLNKIVLNSLIKLDSCKVENNSFNFSGVVAYPERFALTFENASARTVFIIENTNFQMQLDGKNIAEPIISNSPLNDELNHYKNHSKEIFRGIDKLYPRFQKARLENDAEKLAEIGEAMTKIEENFRNYSFQYVNANPTSYISPMILRDLMKSKSPDYKRIEESFNKLSEAVKSTPDSQIISTELELAQEG